MKIHCIVASILPLSALVADDKPRAKEPLPPLIGVEIPTKPTKITADSSGTPSDLNALFRTLDTDNDGKLSREEFAKVRTMLKENIRKSPDTTTSPAVTPVIGTAGGTPVSVVPSKPAPSSPKAANPGPGSNRLRD